MQFEAAIRKDIGMFICLTAVSMAGCGGGDGPVIEARPQSITFAAAPKLVLKGTATVMATASSGLAVTYSSDTPFICSVVEGTGVVSALTPGNCIVAADQYGNSKFAPARATRALPVNVDPNQFISFVAVPAISVHDIATITATADSGLPVTYSSQTLTICTVDATAGLIEALQTGVCTIAADQAGNATYNPASQKTQTITVAPWSGAPSVPGTPAGITATSGLIANTVKVSIGATVSGGSAISGFTVISSPGGIAATGTSSPVTVSCPSTCNGYAFSVVASNATGDSAPSVPADVITSYKVVETFYEPATQPNDSIFTGTFDFNSTTGTVSNLAGYLTESMTGGCATLVGCPGSYGSVPMTLVPLKYQLNVQPVTLGGVNGLLVTTFAFSTTNTFFSGLGGDGWSPQTGVDVGGIYYGYPTAPNPAKGGVGNAYALIFVNIADPTVPLAQAQIDKLAYTDCATGGMMGAVCMTGTSTAGYGAVGTMGGYPVSQVITK